MEHPYTRSHERLAELVREDLDYGVVVDAVLQTIGKQDGVMSDENLAVITTKLTDPSAEEASLVDQEARDRTLAALYTLSTGPTAPGEKEFVQNIFVAGATLWRLGYKKEGMWLITKVGIIMYGDIEWKHEELSMVRGFFTQNAGEIPKLLHEVFESFMRKVRGAETAEQQGNRDSYFEFRRQIQEKLRLPARKNDSESFDKTLRKLTMVNIALIAILLAVNEIIDSPAENRPPAPPNTAKIKPDPLARRLCGTLIARSIRSHGATTQTRAISSGDTDLTISCGATSNGHALEIAEFSTGDTPDMACTDTDLDDLPDDCVVAGEKADMLSAGSRAELEAWFAESLQMAVTAFNPEDLPEDSPEDSPDDLP